MNIPRIVVAVPASGAGKTTIAIGLMAALARQARVQAFKVGPDYIDPTYHSLATGRTARNLDSWMMPTDGLRQSFARACADADIAVIEGVMGLFDGAGASGQGSSAEVAKLLDAPVVLVIDARAMSRSAGAVVHGFRDFDPDVRVARVICNRVGSERHAALVREAVESVGLPVLGCLPYQAALQVPARHLGLHLASEHASFIAQAEAWVQQHIDLDRIRAIANESPSFAAPALTSQIETTANHVRIAVARDAAFCFYYEDNLDLLRAAGAELVPFSPLCDPDLPAGCAGIYLGGGYPELHAAQIANNHLMRERLRQCPQAGMPIYAECGGLMALTESLVGTDGQRHAMFGLLPGSVHMGRRVTLGYRTVQATVDTLLLAAGETARGKEFHYSTWDAPSELCNAYTAALANGQAGQAEGWSRGNLLATYTHLHFASNPAMPVRFADACRRWQEHR